MGQPLDELTKLQSRLRCVANGDDTVNAVRAERSGAVSIAKRPALSEPTGGRPSVKQSQSALRRLPRGATQTALSDDVEVKVFVLYDREDAPTDKLIDRRQGRIATAKVTLSQLKTLNDNRRVQVIELAETLKAPRAFGGPSMTRAPRRPVVERLNEKRVRGPAGEDSLPIGANVMIGIVDVGGIDFAHEEFLDDDGNTRLLRIWDQGGDAFKPPRRHDPRLAFNYGSEITEDDIAVALSEAGDLGVSPHDLAPQSQRSLGSHATHVASIAAGRRGLCPHAKIAAVLVSLPEADLHRRRSFYDTTCLVDAIEYLLRLADVTEGIDAVSINVSLGTNGGAHDGSEMVSRWLDANLFSPGRAITVAAGNAGQEAPQFDGDTGHLSGRIHASGRIPAAELRRDLEWMVIGNGIEDISENEMEIWYGAQDEFAIALRTPDGRWIGPVEPQQRVENLMLPDRTFVSIYNELSDPKNGENKLSIFLSPYMKEAVVGVTPGVWTVRLIGRVIRDGAFHAWIERDDPGRAGDGGLWYLPSYFGDGSYVDNASVSSLACGPRVIGVTNLDAERERINISSSQGPTRDGRTKPDIAAPGTRIVAARGFDPDTPWMEMTGTSMASPYVAGVAGLMLSLHPQLSAAQIAGIMQRTARPLPGASYEWQNDAGYGVIDAAACLREVERLLGGVADRTQAFNSRQGVPS